MVLCLIRANPSLQDSVGFMDFVPRLRLMGENALVVQVEAQRKLLVGIVDTSMKINPDAPQSAGNFGHNNEEGASALIREFGSLQCQWSGVLQDAVYERVIGHLLECVVRSCMKPVLEAGNFILSSCQHIFSCAYYIYVECISESSGGEVCRIFSSLHKLKSALNPPSDGAITNLVESWGKFTALTDLLEYSLSDISEALPKGKFSSFTVL